MRTRRHMSANIEGMLRYFARKKMTGILTDDNGRPLSDSEARAELKRLKALGHKLIPAGDCEGFDPFGGGCPGFTEIGFSQVADHWVPPSSSIG